MEWSRQKRDTAKNADLSAGPDRASVDWRSWGRPARRPSWRKVRALWRWACATAWAWTVVHWPSPVTGLGQPRRTASDRGCGTVGRPSPSINQSINYLFICLNKKKTKHLITYTKVLAQSLSLKSALNNRNVLLTPHTLVSRAPRGYEKMVLVWKRNLIYIAAK